MPLALKRDAGNESQVAVWEIQEEPEYFLSRLQLNEEEEAFIRAVGKKKRYIHWLSSRYLIRDMLDTDEFIKLEFEEKGRPVLKNHPHYVSISHAGDYAAVMLGRQRTGVDIEHIHPKIERIAHKFMRQDELEQLEMNYEIEQLYVYWCIKESLFKWYGRGGLDFKEHLFIEPFAYKEAGEADAIISKKGEKAVKLKLHYEKVEDYMLAYTLSFNEGVYRSSLFSQKGRL